MTKLEKEMCENKEERSFQQMSEKAMSIISDRFGDGSVQQLNNIGEWRDPDGLYPRYGLIYRINPSTAVETNYVEYDVRVQGKNYYYEISSYLALAVGRVDFAGIQYVGSDEWRQTLNVIRFGVPIKVRFIRD